MKVVRFELPDSPGEPRIGFADSVHQRLLDAGAVLARAGVAKPLARAVDIIQYNTENAGSLSRQLKDLGQFDVPAWKLDEITYLPCIEGRFAARLYCL